MHTKIPVKSSFWLTIVIVSTVLLPSMSIDEYTPSMPHMLRALHSTTAMMQLTVTFYMLTFALSQFFLGYVSDGIGRRKVLLYTYPLFFIGSVLCIIAHSDVLLIIGRVIQGLGVGACALVGPALMSDCFEGAELTKISSYYSTVYAFVPISAPIIGGLLQDWLGWRYNFGFMLLVAIITYALYLFKLEETHTPGEQHRMSVRGFIRNYWAVLSHKKYITNVLCMILVWAPIVVFSIIAPFIMQNVLGFSAAAYGFQALLVGLGFFVGNLINSAMIRFTSPKNIIVLGVCVMILMAVVMLILAMCGVVNAWSIMVPVFVIMIGGGMSFPNMYANAISSVPEFGGIAGALIGSLILTGGVIITAIITQFEAHSPVTLAGIYVVMSVICLLIFVWFTPKEV
ncbi:MAG: multidrug effflux MFS transporter [Coxiellaceae bacterium]|nr:multidrug effflux MFS transporter [Coxiellaceae bacterium]